MRLVPPEQLWFPGRRSLSAMGGVVGSWEQLLTLIHLHPWKQSVGVDPSPIFPWNNFAAGASTVSICAEPHLQQKLMLQHCGSTKLAFSEARTGDPEGILPKEGIIPTLPMPCLFGEKIVSFGVNSQVNQTGKLQGSHFSMRNLVTSIKGRIRCEK